MKDALTINRIASLTRVTIKKIGKIRVYATKTLQIVAINPTMTPQLPPDFLGCMSNSWSSQKSEKNVLDLKLINYLKCSTSACYDRQQGPWLGMVWNDYVVVQINKIILVT